MYNTSLRHTHTDFASFYTPYDCRQSPMKSVKALLGIASIITIVTGFLFLAVAVS